MAELKERNAMRDLANELYRLLESVVEYLPVAMTPAQPALSSYARKLGVDIESILDKYGAAIDQNGELFIKLSSPSKPEPVGCEECFSVAEIAEKLSVSLGTARNRVKDMEPIKKVGRTAYYAMPTAQAGKLEVQHSGSYIKQLCSIVGCTESDLRSLIKELAGASVSENQ